MESRCSARQPVSALSRVLAAGALLTPAACAAPPPRPKVTLAMTTLGPADDGHDIGVARGATLRITLPENATTGYRWAIDAVPKALRATAAAADYSSPLIGAPGTASFDFTAIAAGSGDLVLKRWRPWEADNGVIDRWRVHVTVR